MTLLTTPELARRLKIHPSTISKWRRTRPDCPKPVYERRTRAQKHAGKGGAALWDLDAFRAWLKTQPKPAIRTRRRILTGIKHGTRAGYVKGCQCGACTRANTAYFRERRAGGA